MAPPVGASAYSYGFSFVLLRLLLALSLIHSAFAPPPSPPAGGDPVAGSSKDVNPRPSDAEDDAELESEYFSCPDAREATNFWREDLGEDSKLPDRDEQHESAYVEDIILHHPIAKKFVLIGDAGSVVSYDPSDAGDHSPGTPTGETASQKGSHDQMFIPHTSPKSTWTPDDLLKWRYKTLTGSTSSQSQPSNPRENKALTDQYRLLIQASVINTQTDYSYDDCPHWPGASKPRFTPGQDNKDQLESYRETLKAASKERFRQALENREAKLTPLLKAIETTVMRHESSRVKLHSIGYPDATQKYVNLLSLPVPYIFLHCKAQMWLPIDYIRNIPDVHPPDLPMILTPKPEGGDLQQSHTLWPPRKIRHWSIREISKRSVVYKELPTGKVKPEFTYEPWKIGVVLHSSSEEALEAILNGPGNGMGKQKRTPITYFRETEAPGMRDPNGKKVMYPMQFVCIVELTILLDAVEHGHVHAEHIKDRKYLVTLYSGGSQNRAMTQFEVEIDKKFHNPDDTEIDWNYYKRTPKNHRQLSRYPPFGRGTDIWVGQYVELACWGFARMHPSRRTSEWTDTRRAESVGSLNFDGRVESESGSDSSSS